MILNIKVISEEIIKPSNPTSDHLRILQASLFDQANSPVLMPRIFFYNNSHNGDTDNTTATTIISTNEALDRLKGSLPRTLSVFYPLAGRVQDANHINCYDEGVPYVQAQVDKPLEDIVHKAEVSQLDKLLPPYGQGGCTPLLLAIQVNVFACGGLAIGVKMNHAISDAFSLSMFVIAWASMAKGNDNHFLLASHPNFDVWKQFPPHKSNNNIDDEIIENLDSSLEKDRSVVTKWFMFSQTKLDALRSQLISNICMNNKDENNASVPSLGIVLSSFIWSRIKVSCHNCAIKVPHQLSHPVNLRPQVSLPKDVEEQSYYFGNMIVNAMVKPSMDLDDCNNSSSHDPLWWPDILWKMKESIGNIASNDGFIREMQEGKVNLRLIMMEHFERANKGDIVLHGFSNLRSLPVYESDFGWGKPVWVTSATLLFKDLIVFVAASPSSSDIVAYINLSGEHMVKLDSDAEFNAFVIKATSDSSSKF